MLNLITSFCYLLIRVGTSYVLIVFNSNWLLFYIKSTGYLEGVFININASSICKKQNIMTQISTGYFLYKLLNSVLFDFNILITDSPFFNGFV